MQDKNIKKKQNTKTNVFKRGKKVEKQGDSAQDPVWDTNLAFFSHPQHQEWLCSNPVPSSKAKSKSARIHTIVQRKTETRRSNLGNASVWLFSLPIETRRGEACLRMSRSPWRRRCKAAKVKPLRDEEGEGNAPETRWGSMLWGMKRVYPGGRLNEIKTQDVDQVITQGSCRFT